ncbi:MAG: hypothetical protein U9Q38_02585 [Thermodesulfobacteriota bacterium]|nr:hypothetical protein [Thermodesulfobacteriota bacterium]
MGFDFEARIGNIVNALKDYNSATSSPDLSGGLTARVIDDNILPVRSEKIRAAWRGDRFPALFVRVPNAEEEFMTIGGMSGVQNARKQMTVTYDIVGFLGLEGAHKSFENLDSEMRILAKNISSIFYKENTGSGTALWVAPVNYQFDFEDVEGSLVGAVLVQLEGKYFFT